VGVVAGIIGRGSSADVAGSADNFHSYAVVTTVEGVKQAIPQGPVAALEIIKNLGTNGGGFFNANGAHPYDNPTSFRNFLEMLAIVLLPTLRTLSMDVVQAANSGHPGTPMAQAPVAYCLWQQFLRFDPSDPV